MRSRRCRGGGGTTPADLTRPPRYAPTCCVAGKTLLARAVAHHTDCTFIRVSGGELVQKYIGEVGGRHLGSRSGTPAPGQSSWEPAGPLGRLRAASRLARHAACIS